MDVTYRAEGDYQLPNLTVPEAPTVGKYGMLRRSYLKQWRNGLYTGMLLSGKLNQHLEEIDRQASEMMDRLTKQYALEVGATETLKAQDQMQWVQLMENCRNRAEQEVMESLIYS